MTVIYVKIFYIGSSPGKVHDNVYGNVKSARNVLLFGMTFYEIPIIIRTSVIQASLNLNIT